MQNTLCIYFLQQQKNDACNTDGRPSNVVKEKLFVSYQETQSNSKQSTILKKREIENYFVIHVQKNMLEMNFTKFCVALC